MEEKDEFSDILLEQDSNSKSSKFKKITLIAGIFILIFITVLLVMKFLNKPEAKNDGSKLVIEPKEKVEVKTPTVSEPKDDSMFKQVPIVQEDAKKDNFDELVKKLKEKEIKRAKETAEESKTDLEQIVPKAEPVKEAKQEVQQVPIKEVKSISKPKVNKPKKAKPTTVKKATKKPKKIPSIPVPKTSASSSIPSGMYIQVSASSKSKPDTRFIAKLKSKGYPYQLYRTTVKGTKYLKVLVGPYSSSQEARAKMADVKKDLNPKAFVFRVK